MGEAAKKLSTELREQYNEVPWKGMAGVRDRLIHDYFGFNLDIVWNIATRELAEAVAQIESILQAE